MQQGQEAVSLCSPAIWVDAAAHGEWDLLEYVQREDDTISIKVLEACVFAAADNGHEQTCRSALQNLSLYSPGFCRWEVAGSWCEH